MERFGHFIFLLAAALLSSGCAEKRTAADSGDDMYVVSDGMLAVDAAEAAVNGVRILDRNGDVMDGIIVLRSGLTITNEDGGSSVIGPTPVALSVLDENKDSRIDADDPAWENMHLAVDYNADNIIGVEFLLVSAIFGSAPLSSNKLTLSILFSNTLIPRAVKLVAVVELISAP